jgi:D-psicose/D-tagatose/L-ribulose 3-epimerase
MKIGFCMLLWTTSVTSEHQSILDDLKKTGYDGVEIPVFEGTPDDYAALGKQLDSLELDRTAISVIPSLDKNPLSENPAVRKEAVSYLNWVVDCAAALGASGVCGPLHQTLGEFSGSATTGEEFDRAREVHDKVGDYARDSNVKIALEAINRFESYFATTMEQIDTYVESLNHPNIKTMYDTFHANIEECDPINAFRKHSKNVEHVHISENDRGVPGRGHVPWTETFKALKAEGYDNWLTIESFGRGLPELAAATRVWRDFAENPQAVYREGYKTIREGWDTA